MGYIKSQIIRLSKAAGSKSAARKLAKKWFDKTGRDVNEVQTARQPFRSGKIYVFRYDNPKTEDLPWWDRNPVVFALDSVDGDDFGINLNLLPIRVKEDLIDDLYERLEGQIKQSTRDGRVDSAINETQLPITYNGAKAYLDRYGFGFAVRRYKVNRKARQSVVSYNNWANVVLCDFADIEGTNLWNIRRMYVEYNGINI